ncbi:MAG: hypothetical protein M3Z24_14195 [Chloroflexota bacterium]|nr:hypothetical protein [Chloroflexota bacterium]
MQATLPVILTFIATALDGALVGASLDQSIKQLPARHRMGASAFSVYQRAADLGTGIVWYPFIGISSALVTIAAAVATFVAGNSQTLPILIAAILAVLHSIATSQAAPTALSQRNVAIDDAAALTAIFNKFEQWQTVRVVLQVLTFLAVLWAIFVLG